MTETTLETASPFSSKLGERPELEPQYPNLPHLPKINPDEPEPESNGSTPKSDPFAGIEAIMAADAEPVRFSGELYGREWWVSLLPMDGSAFARYASAGRDVRVDTQRKQVSEVMVNVDQDAEEIALLTGSVVDFCFVQRKRAWNSDGEWAYEQTMGKGLNSNQKEQYFRRLNREFRKRLVGACLEVNGLDPLPVSSGTPG